MLLFNGQRQMAREYTKQQQMQFLNPIFDFVEHSSLHTMR